jgi:hypothetical protein
MNASLGLAAGVALGSLALAGCSGTTTVTEACITTGFGAELCGHDAVYFCDEIGPTRALRHGRNDGHERRPYALPARSHVGSDGQQPRQCGRRDGPPARLPEPRPSGAPRGTAKRSTGPKGNTAPSPTPQPSWHGAPTPRAAGDHQRTGVASRISAQVVIVAPTLGLWRSVLGACSVFGPAAKSSAGLRA